MGEDGASVCGDGVVARAAVVERRRLRRRGAPAVFRREGHTHSLFLTGGREEQQGEEGGKGGEGGHPLFVPG